MHKVATRGRAKFTIGFFLFEILQFSHADAAEVHEVHVHVVGHVGVGGLLSVGIVPSAKVIFLRKLFIYQYVMKKRLKWRIFTA